MKAILNHKFIDLEDIKMTPGNRGFRYGDGLFETIAFVNDKPRLLEHHLARIESGARAMRIDSNNHLSDTNISRQIVQLIELNEISGSAIIRIYLWRESEGLYTPTVNKSSCLISVNAAHFEKRKIAKHVGFAHDTFNYSSKWSAIKSLSAMNYVMAGVEKKARNFDEIIILDHRGYVSECLSSNIFWKKDNMYFTPALSTGCIDGVMRKWFIASIKRQQFVITEIEAAKSDLLSASSVFATNASGITHLQSIENIDFNIDEKAQRLIETIS